MSGQGNEAARATEGCLLRLWGHSREEDADGLTVYRPAHFDFPLSRGRDWIEFHRAGAVTFTGPGADDRGQDTAGSWSWRDEGVIEVRRPGAAAQYRMTIQACDDAILKVRWAGPQP